MRPVYIIKEFLNSIQENDFTNAESLVTNTFRMEGWEPDTITSRDYLNLMRCIVKGMPDYKYNYQNFNEKGNTVDFTINITGTHTREIPSILPGIDSVPATNTKVKLPQQNCWVTIKDNKIDTFRVEQVTGGSLMGLFKQLGVDLHLEVH